MGISSNNPASRDVSVEVIQIINLDPINVTVRSVSCGKPSRPQKPVHVVKILPIE